MLHEPAAADASQGALASVGLILCCPSPMVTGPSPSPLWGGWRRETRARGLRSGSRHHPDPAMAPVSLEALLQFLLQQDWVLCLHLHLFCLSHSSLPTHMLWHIEFMLWQEIYINMREVSVSSGLILHLDETWWSRPRVIAAPSGLSTEDHNQSGIEVLGKVLDAQGGKPRRLWTFRYSCMKDTSWHWLVGDFYSPEWKVFLSKWQDLIQKV